MDINASYYTDVGTVKKVNQDSLSLKVVNSPHGKIAFGIVCDGMGGLEDGELASKEVVIAFNNWFAKEFAQMITLNNFSEELIQEQWEEIIEKMNDCLSDYAAPKGKQMGTTLSLLLIYKSRYYLVHVGDSCIFKIDDNVNKLTQDHTLVAEEVRMGKLTEEEARKDSRRNILLQCIGASKVVCPQFESGDIVSTTTFLISSDGFVHNISEQEIYDKFCPEYLNNKEMIQEECKNAIQLVIDRGERDNITLIGIVANSE